MSAGQTNGSPGDACLGQRLSRRERVGLSLGRGLAALPIRPITSRGDFCSGLDRR
jgi:hypothetical protein